MRLSRKRSKVEVVEPNRFIDLDDLGHEKTEENAAIKVKVAEMNDRGDVDIVSAQVYKGNIVVVDYTSISDDKAEVSAVSSRLGAVARDCNGDIVSVGKSMIVITPNGIRIDRNRLKRNDHEER